MSATNAAPETVTIDGITVEKDALERIGQSLKEYWTKTLRRNSKRKQLPEVPHQSSGPADGMPRGSDVGNPTLAKVQRITELEAEIKELTAWLDDVDEVRKGLTDECGTIVDNAYLLPPKQRMSKEDVFTTLSIGRTKYYSLLAEAHLAFLLVLGDPKETGGEQNADKQDTE